MPGRFRIVFVSSNDRKFREIKLVLMEYNISAIQRKADLKEIQSLDLEDIAREKALSAYTHVKNSIIVEDAGLFIDALGGFPGPYSSFVQQTIGCEGILTLLRNKPSRKATFKSALVCADRNGKLLTFLGAVTGTISQGLRGDHGFGFDPIFIPNAHRDTYALMLDAEKNLISHRAIATRKFADWFLTRQSTTD